MEQTSRSKGACCRPLGPCWMALAFLAVLVLVLVGFPEPARAQKGLQGFFAGNSADGGILLAQNHHDISASILVRLAGTSIPVKALSSFNKYCSKVLGGHLLMVRVHQNQGRAGFISDVQAEMTIVAGSRRINFNKQALVDGYAMLDRRDPRFAGWEKYENTGRERRVGIWSIGSPRWPVPDIPNSQVASSDGGSDRERIFRKYGMPDRTNRISVPDRYAYRSYHFYITDFYLREGLVFIYRDGQLVNEQPMSEN